MKLLNDADRLKRNILIKVIKGFLEKSLETTIDQIPIELRPKTMEPSRCCIYKDRAIIRYRLMAALGYGAEDEVDETLPLSSYAEQAMTRHTLNDNVISVNSIACHGCVTARYLVTTACHGCLARPCMNNCPVDAISVHQGQAQIDHKKCISCGKCAQVCPFHAIVRVPVPCEEACPVNAISRGENGKQAIDFETCTACGKCLNACPFGAVLECSHIIDVLMNIAEQKCVVPLVAPSVIGQFEGTLHHVSEALLEIGFAAMEEVAFGAEITTQNEAKEFLSRMKKQERLMTSSCCPAYTETVSKHVPELLPSVSSTRSPMSYAAQNIKKQQPEAITVFIGPCIAKKKEAQADPNVDYVLTFEELDAWFVAAGIDFKQLKGIDIGREAEGYARGFATSCGVTAAVLEKMVKQENVMQDMSLPELDSKFINGLDKKAIKQLKLYANGKLPGNFLEVMSCEGGCVGGPCAIGKLKDATEAVKKAAAEKTLQA